MVAWFARAHRPVSPVELLIPMALPPAVLIPVFFPVLVVVGPVVLLPVVVVPRVEFVGPAPSLLSVVDVVPASFELLPPVAGPVVGCLLGPSMAMTLPMCGA